MLEDFQERPETDTTERLEETGEPRDLVIWARGLNWREAVGM